MKKQFSFTLVALLFAFLVNASNLSRNSIVINDGVVYATANHTTDSYTVTVELISVDGRVQASATITTGQTVQFTLADNSKLVRYTYGSSFTGEDLVMG
ncbi:MAG: hypothetical protein JNN28_15955 [Saprospiraceae bacterium]|nr:hypothetical protein [Saprospiraceae bacterium]